MPLALNAQNTLEVFTTPHGGDGLTSAPAEATLLHDNLPPGVGFLQPSAGAFVRQTITVQAQATDGGSGVASLVLSADAQALTATLSPAPPAPSVTTTATWNTAAVPDGTHTITATATDRAGNSASAARSVIVDNTPPDTQITDGPAAQISTTTATFTFTGTDNLTPVANLQFAWLLDGGAFSAFSPTTTATFSNLTAGSHTFQVKARDLAGNEDPTPAQRQFTVTLLTVRITAPAAGATVPTGSLLVRGTVNAGGAEVGVAVNGIPTAVQGTGFAALIPVTPDTTSLTAVATTTTGATASHTVAITVSGTLASATTLLVSPQSGVVPLTVRFSLPRVPGATIGLDFDGNGTVDFAGPSLEGQTFTYTLPGIYFPRAMVTDAGGTQSTVTAVVNVLAPDQMDALLKGKWNAMKTALIRNDIVGALQFFTPEQQPRFRTLFTDLSAQIAQIAQDMQDIQLVYVIENTAKYRLRRTQPYGGQLVTITYYVYFIQDGTGLWSIEGF